MIDLQAIRGEWVSTTTYTDEGEAYRRIVDDLCDEVERLREAMLVAQVQFACGRTIDGLVTLKDALEGRVVEADTK